MGIHRVLRPTLPARPESDPLVRLERTRRQVLRDGLLGLGLLIGTPFLPGCGSFGSSGGLVSNIDGRYCDLTDVATGQQMLRVFRPARWHNDPGAAIGQAAYQIAADKTRAAEYGHLI